METDPKIDIKKTAAEIFVNNIDNFVRNGIPIFENSQGKKKFSSFMAGPVVALRMAGVQDSEIMAFGEAVEFAAKSLRPTDQKSPSDSVKARRVENFENFKSGVNKVFDNIKNDYFEKHKKG